MPSAIVDLTATYKDAMAPVHYHRVVSSDMMGADVNEGGTHSTYLWYKNGDAADDG